MRRDRPRRRRARLWAAVYVALFGSETEGTDAGDGENGSGGSGDSDSDEPPVGGR